MTKSKKDNILIVDKDSSTGSDLHKILKEEFDVFVIPDEVGVLSYLSSHMPVLIIISADLEGHQGYHICEQIKSQDSTGNIPVLFFSTGVNPENIALGLQIGAADYLLSPFIAPIVINQVKNHIKLGIYEWQLAEELRQHKDSMQETLAVLEAEREKDFRRASLVHTGRLASLGEMATTMAHEISQPLNIIAITLQGWQLLDSRNLLDKSKILKAIPDLLNNVERITFLIDHVRTLGHCTRENTEINICVVMQNALSLCQKQFKNSGISINMNIDENLPFIFAVESEVEQVALNLLSNARYVLDSQHQSEDFSPQISLSCYTRPNAVCFSIEDNGGGVDPADESKIFEPFFSTKEPGEGTGLGLSICRQIIEKYRGTLTLHNIPGQGARFEVSIPQSI